MHVEKLACRHDLFRRPYFSFRNARTAFGVFLDAISFGEGEKVLLPSYIGWSAREGSGVFDPVTQRGLTYDFYRMDSHLHIDLENLEYLFRLNRVKVLVIIHYFGYIDPGYVDAITIARQYGALVLEDEAHALFTDLIGGISGRLGDASIFSLHKLLPLPDGGLLILNNGDFPLFKDLVPQKENNCPLWHFDLSSIARKRIENAKLLDELLQPYHDMIIPLRSFCSPGEVPQTYPALISGEVSRDRLYEMMNETGYGVVSLYHTMIDSIPRNEFLESYAVSRQILNLPVHQDLDHQMLATLVSKLVECMKFCWTAHPKGHPR